MNPLATAFVFIICAVIVAGVIINLWPDAQPLIQNITAKPP